MMVRGCAVLLLCAAARVRGEFLLPQEFNLAKNKPVTASATCGELSDGQPVREMYCSLGGAVAYSPSDGHSHVADPEDAHDGQLAELRAPSEPSMVQGGQSCDVCEAGTAKEHPIENIVDGTSRWWQSPPLSRGMHFNQVNITIDLQQEFQIVYVVIVMANSPRPGAWMLEKSNDHGESWQPWQYFASTAAECARMFGADSLQPNPDDDSVICTSEYSAIVPLWDGEIFVRLLNNRPNRLNFSHSEKLQNFTTATNVRIRLLKSNTLQGHLMDVSRKKDPTVTRRYFYAIKEVFMGGRCVCHGHAKSCDVLDGDRSKLLCRCEHNTCGDHCEQCCPGFQQKPWKPARQGLPLFQCEPCNCFGHSETCEYHANLEGKSIDIHGDLAGGGLCMGCRDNTAGINCNQCAHGYYRPNDRQLNDTNVCEACPCADFNHMGTCSDGDGHCACKEQFAGEKCDRCADGFDQFPTCRPCDCDRNGTDGAVCQPINGQCPCLPKYGGVNCDSCEHGYFDVDAGCIECQCDADGSLHSNCSQIDGQCACQSHFGNVSCDQCAHGHFNYPNCTICDCDVDGSQVDICDKDTGACLCKDGFTDERCSSCDAEYYGFPSCQECGCEGSGVLSSQCRPNGQCECAANFTGRTCDRCSAGYYSYPECRACDCLGGGSEGLTCDDAGKCLCKPNFTGTKCDACAKDFYNFPICEDCNCDPAGTAPDFPGCAKLPQVQLKDLCRCKPNVAGRKCERCAAQTWNLDAYNPDGCEDCGCSGVGSVSALNECSGESGQCQCKPNVGGRACDECLDGFFRLAAAEQAGCSPCACDVGGAMMARCDKATGRCRCKPRVGGDHCTEPLDTFFTPGLWHMKYEAEAARVGSAAVRYADDPKQFANFSSIGYAVLATIQSKIEIDVDIAKPSLYRLVLHYAIPENESVTATLRFVPLQTFSSEDAPQEVTAELAPSKSPQSLVVPSNSAPQPFVLNQGRWVLEVETPDRFFLDYVVLLPAEYYEGTLLREKVQNYCKANVTGSNATACTQMKYAPLTEQAVTIPGSRILNADDLSPLPAYDDLATLDGEKVGRVNNDSDADLIAQPEDIPAGLYVAIIEYFNPNSEAVTVNASLPGGATASVTLSHCPYSHLCRDVLTADGAPALANVTPTDDADVRLALDRTAAAGTGIGAVHLVPRKQWHVDLLRAAIGCVTTADGQSCAPQKHPAPAEAATVQAESGPSEDKAIAISDLPFGNGDGVQDARVVPLDAAQATVEMAGEVPNPNHYTYVLHYYNPGNQPHTLDVLLEAGTVYEGSLPIEYCPNVAGCRAVVQGRTDPDFSQFWTEDKFRFSAFRNDSQEHPVYMDYIMAVPHGVYNEDLLSALHVDKSDEFVQKCAPNGPTAASDVPGECRAPIFSLTADFNNGAFECACDAAGSKSFVCDKFSGQCECRANVVGRSCSRCQAGHFDFPDCRPCECNSAQQCDARTGQCFCPLHTEGRQCERCAPDAFGFDALIGCSLCGCDPDGLDDSQPDVQCDPLSGQCLCKDRIGGRRCDQCTPGYFGFQTCDSCRCDKAGTTAQVCDGATGSCICKKNAIGVECRACAAGSYNLEATNPLGCTDCFCFGKSAAGCRSSDLVRKELFAMDGWTAEGEAAALTSMSEANAVMIEKNGTGGAYFVAPPAFTGKQMLTFGGRITYMLSSLPANDSATADLSADIIIQGHNLTIEHRLAELPPNARETFFVYASLLPEKWKLPGGANVSRAQFMSILNELSAIRVKAHYFDSLAEAKLSEFTMMTAERRTARGHNDMIATEVEVCDCPAAYKGTSCEHCADGHYRVETDADVGACVPCDCHGHSESCDAASGVCTACRDDTVGDHCERCAVGFFGNATGGSPNDCARCPCPRASADQSFASSCDRLADGSIRCNCMDGFTGDRCEFCDVGFFGNPLDRDGWCTRCSCNDNNDLTVEGACDKGSGVCAQCLNNTTGSKCEECDEWFFGDAVDEKNCVECECNRCGTRSCSTSDGVCDCLPLVTGDHCTECEADAWGLESCSGCKPCDCANASMSSQCDLASGQCPCRYGAGGQRCDQCKNGFWNYTSNGCRRCDCEADLSMGTVCDVATGQCQCQEGATGARCDQCIDNYLRIPELGCRECDECVHVLDADLDGLETRISDANDTMANVSTTALTGARLSRINQTVLRLTPNAATLVSSADDLGLNGVREQVDAALENATATSNKAQRTLTSAGQSKERADEQLAAADEAAVRSVDAEAAAREAVARLSSLADGFSSESSAAADRERLGADAAAFLEAIRGANLALADDALTNHTALLNQTQENLQATILDMQDLLMKHAENASDRVERVIRDMQDHQDSLNEARINQDAAQAIIDRISGNDLLLNGITVEEELTKWDDNLRSAASDNKETNETIKQLSESYAQLSEHSENLNKSLSETTELSENTPVDATEWETELDKMNAHADRLSAQATGLSDEMGDTQEAAKTAVSAGNAYKSIAEAVSEAETAAKNATQSAMNAVALVENEITDAKEALEGVHETLGLALKQSANVNLMGRPLDKGKEAFEDAAATVDELQQRADAIDAYTGLLQSSVAVGGSSRPLARASEDSEAAVQSVMADSAAINAQLEQIDEYANDLAPKIEELKSKAEENVARVSDSRLAFKTATALAQQLAEAVGPVVESLTDLQLAAANASVALSDVDAKLASVRRKLATARDIANRIRVGAKFGDGSSLQLQNPARITRAAAYTDIQLYCATGTNDGLLVFFGSEDQKALASRALPTNDYVAIDVAEGKPRVHVELGDGQPFTLPVDTFIADNEWRRLRATRTGKVVTLEVEKEGEPVVRAQGLVPGAKSVLNVHQDLSRFYVGGVPDRAQMPGALRSRHFVGRIEDVSFNGEAAGLWNFALNGSSFVSPSLERGQLSQAAEGDGASFNGDGYIVLKRNSWNPRKQTQILLSFKTFAHDALLIYVGKDRDYLALDLTKGRLSLKFNLGAGQADLTSERAYDDGEWHTVMVDRDHRNASVRIDGDHPGEYLTGQSPIDKFELQTGDVYFVGGIPNDVARQLTKPRFKGCIRDLKVGDRMVNLNDSPERARGVVPGCPELPLRVVGLTSDQSALVFEGLRYGTEMELSLRFRTKASAGRLALVSDTDQRNVVELRLADGRVVATTRAGDAEDTAAVELASASDGHWHFVTVSRTSKEIRLDVDDQFSEDAELSAAKTYADVDGSLRFGELLGCVGDVTLNGRSLDFADANATSASLVGCHMHAATPPVVGAGAMDKAKQRSIPPPPPVTTPTSRLQTPNPEECALGREPLGEREDTYGHRFGLETNSHLQYGNLAEPFDAGGVFSMQFRATAFSGVLLFATNEQHTDFFAVYMQGGQLTFAFNSGSGTAILKSQRSFVDTEWHSASIERSGRDASLYVDDVEEATGVSPGRTYSIDTQPPFFVGGVAPELVPLAARLMPGVNPTFGGCLRDVKLNGRSLGEPTQRVGAYPCAQYSEPGLYFGDGTGYVVLDPKLNVGESFSIELHVRPRVKTAVLLALSRGDADFLALQLVDGAVNFSVDAARLRHQVDVAPSQLVHDSEPPNALCDGHWHTIKIYKTKNLMTVAVDGVSKLHIMKQAHDLQTADPLYLGGVPSGYRTRGLSTRESFVGCVRVVSMGRKPRRMKKSVSLDDMEIVGDVTRNGCPVN